MRMVTPARRLHAGPTPRLWKNAVLKSGSAAPSLRTLGKAHGSLPRRRATLVVPEGGGDAVPVLRTRHSVLGLYGFSPAQVSPSPCSLITHPSSLTDPIPISPRNLRVLS